MGTGTTSARIPSTRWFRPLPLLARSCLSGRAYVGAWIPIDAREEVACQLRSDVSERPVPVETRRRPRTWSFSTDSMLRFLRSTGLRLRLRARADPGGLCEHLARERVGAVSLG